MEQAPPSAPAPAPWQRRLHAALMPDYTPQAAAYWWAAVVAGSCVLVWSFVWLLAQPWTVWAQVGAALALSVGSGLFPIRVPGTKQSFAVGEIFVFLVLLALGPQAAVLAAAGETALGACRTSKRLTSRLLTPAVTALALGSTGWGLQRALSAMKAAGLDGAAWLMAATMLFAAAYFIVNAVMLSGVLRLKRGEPFFRAADLVELYRWVALSYAGSGSVAALLFITWQAQGAAVLGVMVPLLAMLMVTLHFYFRQQESGEALREASAAAAAREAALAEQAAEAASSHLLELQASEQRFHRAFTHASIGMALMAFNGRILQANPALATLLGRTEDALRGEKFQDFVATVDRLPLEQQLGLAGHQEFEGFTRELRCPHADGSTLWLSLHCSFFTDHAEGPCLILQAQDVTARRTAEAGLQHLAFHDPLTGLPNRRRFMECLVGALSRAQADPGHTWAVMFIDFDRFKLVNDSLGHHVGDQLLLQMARRIQEKLRPNDIVARLGGDEFALLVSDITHERDAIVLAERLMDAMRRPFVLGDVELIASASIGFTFSAIGYDNADAVLRDADTAMYKAKAAGKARYALFDSGLHTAVSERLRLEGELRAAIDKGQLAVVYQPMFSLEPAAPGVPPTRQLHGFEALVRWQHPQDGTLVPAEFLPIAEESGLMLQLSDFVLHCACQQLRQWQLSEPRLAELTMSINLSAHDIAHPALVARVSRAIVEAGLRPEHLTLEITENILMSNIDGALGTLEELRRLGVHLAVDDFGTGYSSLSHLSRLPIDSLKIDRSFVRDLRRGSAESAVVSAIIQLGGTLRKQVVAEGIETEAQMSQLHDLGCGYGQGFLLASPLTEHAAGEWLRAQRGSLH